MSGVAIYMEGGGDGHGTKAALRQGMDVFLGELKDAVRAKSWRWKLVPCGGRQAAFEAFVRARSTGEMTVVALLVDAEGPVTTAPRVHLEGREGWHLGDVSDEVVHLMIQSMEAWIVADRDALGAYYGQGFQANQLPGGTKAGEGSKGQDRRQPRGGYPSYAERRLPQNPPRQ